MFFEVRKEAKFSESKLLMRIVLTNNHRNEQNCIHSKRIITIAVIVSGGSLGTIKNHPTRFKSQFYLHKTTF